MSATPESPGNGSSKEREKVPGWILEAQEKLAKLTISSNAARAATQAAGTGTPRKPADKAPLPSRMSPEELQVQMAKVSSTLQRPARGRPADPPPVQEAQASPESNPDVPEAPAELVRKVLEHAGVYVKTYWHNRLAPLAARVTL